MKSYNYAFLEAGAPVGISEGPKVSVSCCEDQGELTGGAKTALDSSASFSKTLRALKPECGIPAVSANRGLVN